MNNIEILNYTHTLDGNPSKTVLLLDNKMAMTKKRILFNIKRLWLNNMLVQRRKPM